MSTVLVIPLAKATDVSELVADKKPGDKLYGCMSIKSLDEQTLVVRLEEVTDKISDLPKPGEYDEDEGEDDENQDDDDGSTPGESEDAANLAAPGGYAGP